MLTRSSDRPGAFHSAQSSDGCDRSRLMGRQFHVGLTPPSQLSRRAEGPNWSFGRSKLKHVGRRCGVRKWSGGRAGACGPGRRDVSSCRTPTSRTGASVADAIAHQATGRSDVTHTRSISAHRPSRARSRIAARVDDGGTISSLDAGHDSLRHVRTGCGVPQPDMTPMRAWRDAEVISARLLMSRAGHGKEHLVSSRYPIRPPPAAEFGTMRGTDVGPTQPTGLPTGRVGGCQCERFAQSVGPVG